ncbi:MAG: hypothetical protein JSR58_04020 [Verrucomicrobia bacterium]|nr:hypothetical protein [Verrucomicrobiota bacterium]
MLSLSKQANSLDFSPLDRESLALFLSLRDNPEIQKDEALCKMFKDAVSFMTASFPQALIPVTQITSTSEPVSGSPFILIDTSGEQGDNGYPGNVASCLSGRGLNGTDGSHGKNARDIHLRLAVKEGIIVAQWDNNQAMMKWGDPSAAIFLRAIGGKGGYGGGGGKGGAGIPGEPGRNATRFSPGENGQRGERGGPGGNGGDGGNGGKGGNVTVYVDPLDADLLMLLNPPEINGGEFGNGGLLGKGGKGGSGGKGGTSFSWSETTYVSVYDSFSHSFRSEPRTISGFNPGGTNGLKGLPGQEGTCGENGKPGLNGTFQMVVGENAYQTIYDLAIRVSKIVDLTQGNPSDINEPGEWVNLMVTATNIGGMPTPLQDIEVSLQTAVWIEQKNGTLVLKASEQLAAGSSHTFNSPFSFRIKDEPFLTEELLNKQEQLTYCALLSRVNKSFPHVGQQKDFFSVKYPLHISSLTVKTFSLKDVSTLRLSIQNISSIVMGKLGPQKRRAFVVFEIIETEEIKYGDMEFEGMGIHKNSIELEHLAPKSEKQVDFGLRFTNRNLRASSKVVVVASLFLEYFNSKANMPPEQARCIQRQKMELSYT